jgi:hypothetical protein
MNTEREQSAAVVNEIASKKLRFNSRLILENAATIKRRVNDLIDSAENMHMDEISDHLKAITDAAIGCRSRLQFMRGLHALNRAYENSVKGLPKRGPEDMEFSDEGARSA